MATRMVHQDRADILEELACHRHAQRFQPPCGWASPWRLNRLTGRWFRLFKSPHPSQFLDPMIHFGPAPLTSLFRLMEGAED